MLTTDASRRPCSSGKSSVYDCVDSSLFGLHNIEMGGRGVDEILVMAAHDTWSKTWEKLTQHWKGGRGVEENLLSLLRMAHRARHSNSQRKIFFPDYLSRGWTQIWEVMAHRARHSNSQRKIRFPDYLSQGWTRILEVLILWTWVIHLKLRSRASYVNTSCHVCAWFMESSLHCICASYRGETYAGEIRITSRFFAVGPHKDLIRTSARPQ